MTETNIRPKSFWGIVILLVVILLTYSIKGEAMSLIKGKEVYVFSAMEGTITYQGKPAAGAKIVRTVRWKDEKGESDSTIAGENGEFSLPPMKRTLKQILPAQFLASQEIYVYYKEQEFHIWTMGKIDRNEYGELGGRPKNFRCELLDELERVEVKIGLLGTSCKWDFID